MASYFLTFKELIDEAERVELRDYALKLQAEGRLDQLSVGMHGQFNSMRQRDSALVTPLLRALGDRVERLLGVAEMPMDAELGWVISVVERGGFVRTHRDRKTYKETARKHLRCNVVVSKPEQGGTPVIEGQLVHVEERGAWAFFASEYKHSAFPVGGDKPRIIYQFGYSVPLDWQLPG